VCVRACVRASFDLHVREHVDVKENMHSCDCQWTRIELFVLEDKHVALVRDSRQTASTIEKLHAMISINDPKEERHRQTKTEVAYLPPEVPCHGRTQKI
jgi:hypothetical protein